MGQNFKSKFRKTVVVLLLIFLILFLFRLAYGYTKTTDISFEQNQLYSSFMDVKRNYASQKYEQKGQASAQIDQKYEKIAEISTQSTKFDKEEERVREEISNHEGLIQYERKSGNSGSQRLDLLVGVPPGNFDSLYSSLTSIGATQSKHIIKTDKTNEYKELNAKKASLEKIRSSLISLKSKGGKIDEYMSLENRILEIEQQLQDLGVSLGDFDDENEFCTVKFSLIEKSEVRISFIHRVKVALEWSIKYYLRVITILLFIVLFSYLLLVIIEKLKLIEKIINKK